MPGIDEKNDTEEDEMEQDTPDSEKSDEDEESDTASGTDDDESSGTSECLPLFIFCQTSPFSLIPNNKW